MGLILQKEENVVIKDNYYLSNIYVQNLDKEQKKNKGIYYTPKVVVDYIIEKTIKKHDFIKNPYLKILDISCGCGNFLLEVYDVLYLKFEEKIEELKTYYNDDYWNVDNIHNHIIDNCIYGCDIDYDAIEILKYSLKNKSENKDINNLNIICCDSLKSDYQDKNIKNFFDNKFDYIIGNPPYIGQKVLDKEYKKYLQEEYSEVYKDKSDIYYCFYKRIISLLKENQIGSIITPRYFMESPSGKHLRNYINENTYIEEIIDFYGFPIFKNVGVASCIFTFKNEKKKNDKVDILKMKNESLILNDEDNLNSILNETYFDIFKLNQNSLKETWILAKEEDMNIYINFEQKSQYELGDICESFQGIITGCDKAFIVTEDTIDYNKDEYKLLKSWIKNRNINKYAVCDGEKKLIYSDDISDEEKYENILNYISNYKEKLEKRRECIKNIRKWYQLQWGRNKNYFEKEKIIFPYKCSENKFAIDKKNRYFSADVYSMYIKEQYKNEFSYEYLIGLLNSSVYDKYFKLYAKKMSQNVYDYYPNSVMKLKIFKNDISYYEIENLSKQLIKINEKNNITEFDKNKCLKMQKQIDKIIIENMDLHELI